MNTGKVPLIGRWFAYATVALTLLAATFAFGHDGHGAARVQAKARVVEQGPSTLYLELELINLASYPVTLFAVVAEGAAPLQIDPPLVVGGYDVAQIKLRLNFSAGVPSIFTAQLNFAEHGTGPVLVMP